MWPLAQTACPMGADYTLAITLKAPNGTVQEVVNTSIIGNLSVIGLACAKRTPSRGCSSEEQDAARLLYEEALNYIDRWNQAEDELAKFLQIAVSRPIPTIVTLGGVIDVTYLLDTPHGFAWKGLYVDANLRVAETAGGYLFSNSQINTGNLFKQISGLEGSALEGRLIEDDFGVTSISTSELFALAHQNSVQIQTIDNANITTILPTLPFDDTIKENISNAVNQGLTVQIPSSEITYEDWTGIGYLIQNPDTNDSGWMLTGMIAGGMTVLSPDNPAWESIPAIQSESERTVNTDPSLAAKIFKISATDMQKGAVGTQLEKPIQVMVMDAKNRPVQGALVTFAVKAGGGLLNGKIAKNSSSCQIATNEKGIAEISCTPGQKTSANPAFIKGSEDTYAMQVGLNVIDANVNSSLRLKVPFTAYGFPDKPAKMIKTNPESGYWENNILSFGGFTGIQITDQYDNPIANETVTFSSVAPSSSCVSPDAPNKAIKFIDRKSSCLNGYPRYEECGSTDPFSIQTDEKGCTIVHLMIGTIPNADYTITAASKTLSTDFICHTYPVGNCDSWNPSNPGSKVEAGALLISNDNGIPINCAAPGTQIDLKAFNRIISEVSDTNTYQVKDVENGVVTFNGNQAVYAGNGLYTYSYTIKAGVNDVNLWIGSAGR